MEVHFTPTVLINPFNDRKLQKWINRMSKSQFQNKMGLELCIPTMTFNIVYLIIHIFRHLFGEGVGLRQVMDLYFIIRSSSETDRKEASKILCSFGLKRFTESLLYVMEYVFGLDEEYKLFSPNKKHGVFLLNEIMLSGNMGHTDVRVNYREEKNRMARFLKSILFTSRLIKEYPVDVICEPLNRIIVNLKIKKYKKVVY